MNKKSKQRNKSYTAIYSGNFVNVVTFSQCMRCGTLVSRPCTWALGKNLKILIDAELEDADSQVARSLRFRCLVCSYVKKLVWPISCKPSRFCETMVHTHYMAKMSGTITTTVWWLCPLDILAKGRWPSRGVKGLTSCADRVNCIIVMKDMQHPRDGICVDIFKTREI